MSTAPAISVALPSPFPLTDLDREILSQTDEESWSIAIKSLYGTITNYICRERLRWPLDLDPATQCVNQTPFADPHDYKILRNDWPYGVTPDINHIVVWVKNPIPVDEQAGGDLTPESRALIEGFVQRTFVKRLEKEFPDAKERVLWFKNWTALQSVRTLEHIHVLLRNVPDDIVVEWTGESARKLSDPTVGLVTTAESTTDC
ncbi:conserved hypothetical protein [Uncinocarpus reesii 1704]|uniref:N-acetylglucosamine-induced protein 1 n=1 Tax=Uncinocarpus reesii (strain UAMH 1704) TaxID=336963 RepID=C4JXI1_UNCRE|nr:uncharacterized protein UREG_06354 [Uncinocarpus reesii 1704]EEP81489.1 conserved hypothetical protein [Uncinocarpus reesii 1704]